MAKPVRGGTVLGAVLLLAACSAHGAGEGRSPTVTTPARTEATATTEATVASTIQVTTTVPLTRGEPGPGCINGWTTPTPGTLVRTQPLDIIRTQMGVTGEFRVVEMRYFTGPEVPWILEPPWTLVHRWYVKAELVEAPTFRARWLVERRSPAIAGVAGVASFDTSVYQSPDWRGFIGEGEPRSIDGLPGTWVGIDYDFTAGEMGDNPGWPSEVGHCLDGT